MDSTTQILQNFTEYVRYDGKNSSGARLYDVILSCRKGKSREAELPKWQANLEQKLKAAHVPFESVSIMEERCKSIWCADDEGRESYSKTTERGYFSIIRATIVM